MYTAGLLREILRENKQTAPAELIIRAGYNLSSTNSMLLTEHITYYKLMFRSTSRRQNAKNASTRQNK